MATKYWLKPISNEAGGNVDPKWVEHHPWLLGLVGSGFTMKDIRSGDFVIFYAKGHKTIVAIARVSESGDTRLDPERVRQTGAEYALSVQVILAIPNAVGRAPSYEVIPGVERGDIQGGRPVLLDQTQFLAGWKAIAQSALPDGLDGCAEAQ